MNIAMHEKIATVLSTHTVLHILYSTVLPGYVYDLIHVFYRDPIYCVFLLQLE